MNNFRESIREHMKRNGTTAYELTKRTRRCSLSAARAFMYLGRNAKCTLVEELADLAGMELAPRGDSKALDRLLKVLAECRCNIPISVLRMLERIEKKRATR